MPVPVAPLKRRHVLKRPAQTLKMAPPLPLPAPLQEGDDLARLRRCP